MTTPTVFSVFSVQNIIQFLKTVNQPCVQAPRTSFSCALCSKTWWQCSITKSVAMKPCKCCMRLKAVLVLNIFIANKFPVMYTMSVKDIWIYLFELVHKAELHVDMVSCHCHSLLCWRKLRPEKTLSASVLVVTVHFFVRHLIGQANTTGDNKTDDMYPIAQFSCILRIQYLFWNET